MKSEIRISIRLNPDLTRALDKLRELEIRNNSDIVRDAITEYYENHCQTTLFKSNIVFEELD